MIDMDNKTESKKHRTDNEKRQPAPGAAVQKQPKNAQGQSRGTQRQPKSVLGLRLDAEEARRAIILSEIISAPLAKRRRRR